MPKEKINKEQSYAIRYCKSRGESVAFILKKEKRLLRGISASTVYRHARMPLGIQKIDNRVGNHLAGRKRLLDDRDRRAVIKKITGFRRAGIDFTSEELYDEMDLADMDITNFRRYLKRWGYGYLNNRRKGVITQADKVKRLAFARRMKRSFTSVDAQLQYWRSILFIDIVGFQYKRNPFELATTPKAKSWKKKNESLVVTRKGKKEGIKSARFLVGITHGLGITVIDEVPPQMNGHYFAYMIRLNHLEPGLTQHRRVLQDNDKVQNSQVAKKRFAEKNITLVKIPPRSPDVNVIENLFNQIRMELNQQAKSIQKTKETMDEFKERVKRTTSSYSIQKVNNLIDSLPRRMDALVKAKGTRLKY